MFYLVIFMKPTTRPLLRSSFKQSGDLITNTLDLDVNDAIGGSTLPFLISLQF
jgi:hypothetical protein